MKHLLIIFSLFFILIINAQTITEVQEPDYIKSIELKPLKINTYLPVIKLGESIRLKFDDLEGDQKDYTYKITHCNYNWENSNLSDSDFSTGFAEDRIRNYENSFNTFQEYTHYELQIPNEYVRLKISGNYLISIINDDEEIIFTRRFIVYQPKVDVGVSAHRARKIEDIDKKQNIEFLISHPNLLIDNPSEEIKVALYQNFDWNSVITNIKPQFIRGTQLLYKYGDKTTYFGNNEFLFFDSKNYRNATNNIRRAILKDDIYQTRLYVDENRANKSYTYYPDVNGYFVLRSINTDNPSIESEYTNVHFFLDYYNHTEKEIYVYGAFNNWQITPETKMTYNEATNLYETSFLLKQGFYNYEYVTVDSNGNINIPEINGSFYQTENDYQVLVYYHKFGSKYDEVIGFGVGNSIDLKN